MSAREYCGIAEARCVNPPGYQVGSSSGPNPDSRRVSTTCHSCGEFVCAACRLRRRGEWWCLHCLEREALDNGHDLTAEFDHDAFVARLKWALRHPVRVTNA